MFTRFNLVLAVAIAAAVGGGASATRAWRPAPAAARDSITVPSSIQDEHMELMASLVAATHEPGPVGEAARLLSGTLQPHFDREERIALPPLSLLRPLADGSLPPDAQAVLPLTDTLLAELPRMLDEHHQIDAAISHFQAVCMNEGVYRYELLAVELRRHARMEEEVLYPAAILVGDLVRARQAGFARK
jgi:hypothetical protein